MLKDNYRLKNNEVVTLIPVGDVHIGSSQFNEEFFEYWRSVVSKIKKNKRIYLMGDMLESASKNVGNSAFSTNMSVNDQKEYLIDILKPFKEDIVVYVIGNHENRISNEFNFDMVSDIARELGIESGHQYFDSFQINDEVFDVMVRHGKGSSGQRHLAMGKLERNTANVKANLYMEGHCHRCMWWNNLVRTSKGIERKYYAYTGAFLNYDGYPDSMYLPVEPPAFQTISINKNMRVKSTSYYCDICCPEIEFM